MHGLELLAHEPRSRIIPLQGGYSLGHEQVYPMTEPYMIALMLKNHLAGLFIVTPRHHDDTHHAERGYPLIVDKHHSTVIDHDMLTLAHYHHKPRRDHERMGRDDQYAGKIYP